MAALRATSPGRGIGEGDAPMFSVGNLITLLVVVAILFAYRYFDARRGALDKVKRYADRVAKGVAQSVDQKAAEVRDLAIELQVNLKTGAELLKRVRAIAGGLTDRVGEVERLGERLRAHDATVTELARGTRAAQEELRQVAAECAAIPALKEHLGGVRGETAGLELRVRGAAAAVTELDQRIAGLLAQREELHGVRRDLAQARELGNEVLLKAGQLQAQHRQVETLHGAVHALEQDVERLHPGVGEARATLARLQDQIQSLAAGSDRAAEALAALGRIDAAMAEAEQRAARLQVAREWLARTETRLAEVGAGAQEQVRLLEALLREERSSAAAENGSAALGKRETVLKLAAQGWSVPEIARAARLSRGEVELTLEVGASSARSLPEYQPAAAPAGGAPPPAAPVE